MAKAVKKVNELGCMAELASLTSLNVSYNRIGNVGGTALAKALAVNASLTSLDLGMNGIGEAKRVLRNIVVARPGFDLKL